MNIDLYLVPFSVAFAFSVGLSWGMIHFGARWFRSMRIEGGRGTTLSVRRLGGAAMIGAFFLAFLFERHLVMTPQLVALLSGTFGILCFGIIDDIRPIRWTWQLLFQGVLAAVVFLIGLRLEYMTNLFDGTLLSLHSELFGWWPSVLVGTVWFVLVMNAVNWLDGSDGLLGGVASIAFLVLFFLCLRPEVNQPPLAILSLLFLGVTLGMWVWNVPPARIVAGTAGAFFIGFGMASLSLFAGAKVATAFLVLSLPMIDAAFVILDRVRNGRSLFSSDRSHLHHRLSECGWSPQAILLLFLSLTAVLGLSALFIHGWWKVVGFLCVGGGIGSLLYRIKKVPDPFVIEEVGRVTKK